MTFRIVNPESLGAPKGYSHGILTPARGRVLFVAGQPGWDEVAGRGGSHPPGAAPGFAEQFARALDRVLAVVRAAGGDPGDIARLTVYVRDLGAYREARRELGDVWWQRFGTYYPAMALLEVSGLVDTGAEVEIEATAVLDGESSHGD